MYLDTGTYHHFPTSVLLSGGGIETNHAVEKTSHHVGNILVNGISHSANTTKSYINTLFTEAEILLEDMRKRNSSALSGKRGWE